MAGVLLTRGPDAVLAKGSTIEMLLGPLAQLQRKRTEFWKLPAAPGIGFVGSEAGKSEEWLFGPHCAAAVPRVEPAATGRYSEASDLAAGENLLMKFVSKRPA